MQNGHAAALRVGVLALLAGAVAGGVVSRRSLESTATLELEHGSNSVEGGHALEHHEEEPKPYKFSYGVKDDHQGLDFNQHEASDGHVVSGQYRVQLPDGRTQVVTYTADWKNGYNANVQYEGEANHPKQAAAHAAPAAPGHGWAHDSEHLGLGAAAVSGEYHHHLAGAAIGGGSSYSSGGGDHSGGGSKWTPSHP